MTTTSPDITAPTTDRDLALDVRGLRRVYGTGKDAFEAVRGIDLAVPRGQLFALLGTNGAGKTSTLEVLEGLAPATDGTVRVLGADPVAERERVRHRTGVMLQEAGFPDELTVAETARMWHGTLSRPRPAAAALAAVELSHREGVRVSSLSGGERRRLDLALAIMGDPELLFLDEPTTGLDPESRHRTWGLVRAMLDEGTTVVLTTHYLEEAAELAQDIAIMHEGRIAAHGTHEEIVAAEPARITFRTPHGTAGEALARDLDRLPALTGDVLTAQGRVHLRSTDLQATLHALLDDAARGGVHLEGLDARSASLEQVFLRIAGTAGDVS